MKKKVISYKSKDRKEKKVITYKSDTKPRKGNENTGKKKPVNKK